MLFGIPGLPGSLKLIVFVTQIVVRQEGEELTVEASSSMNVYAVDVIPGSYQCDRTEFASRSHR